MMLGIARSAETMSTLTWLEKIVGAEVSEMTNSLPPANAEGADLRPARTESVAVKIMIESVMTIVTLGRIRRMVPPP